MDNPLIYIRDERVRNVIFEKYYIRKKTQWTKNCIICFDSVVTLYGGHVHQNTTSVIAGFCSKHSGTEALNEKSCMGCYGECKIEMGRKEI
jgi:hypothetical protein